MEQKYTISISLDPDGMYIGEVEGLPAAYTQAPNIPLLMERLMEVSAGAIQLSNVHASSDFSLVVHE